MSCFGMFRLSSCSITVNPQRTSETVKNHAHEYLDLYFAKIHGIIDLIFS
jgi:hypothetical protein